jgi:hypothetical protein
MLKPFMKNLMLKICSPILNIFESGDEEYAYKASHRKILIVAGILFLALSVISFIAIIYAEQLGGIIPILVFFVVGVVCEVVGLLGSDRAVAKMWKSK